MAANRYKQNGVYIERARVCHRELKLEKAALKTGESLQMTICHTRCLVPWLRTDEVCPLGPEHKMQTEHIR